MKKSRWKKPEIFDSSFSAHVSSTWRIMEKMGTTGSTLPKEGRERICMCWSSTLPILFRSLIWDPWLLPLRLHVLRGVASSFPIGTLFGSVDPTFPWRSQKRQSFNRQLSTRIHLLLLSLHFFSCFVTIDDNLDIVRLIQCMIGWLIVRGRSPGVSFCQAGYSETKKSTETRGFQDCVDKDSN